MKIKENLKQTAINAYLYLKAFCFWLVMGAAIGAHVGPGACGLCYIEK